MSDKATAVGHIPSGLFIITSISENGEKDGYLASWVQQVSFDPLMIAFTISDSRPGYKKIKSGGVFSINVVGEHETQYMRHFWKGYAPGEGPFGEIKHEVSSNGGLIISDAKSTIECKMTSSTKPGDHEVIFAEVVASHVQNEESKPKVHIRKSGLDY